MRMGKQSLVFMIICLVLAGCNAPPTQLAVQKAAANMTPTISPTPSPLPTSSATSAPIPTATLTFTPAPTETPFGQFSAREVIVQKFAGLDIFEFTADGDEIKNLTQDLPGDKLFLGWSPDGKSILVGEYETKQRLSFTKMKLWLINVQSGERRNLLETNGETRSDWSPNGETILVECYDGKICLVDTTSFQVTKTRFSGNPIGFSPDGRLAGWDNLPAPRLAGKKPFKPVLQHGTLYTWKPGAPDITPLLSYSSYLGSAGTYWAHDSLSLYILDAVNGKSALAQVFLDGRPVKHLYQFERDVCAVGLSPNGELLLLRGLVVESETATCSGALGLAFLDQDDLAWFDMLKDIKWLRWTADNKGLVVMLQDGTEYLLDLVHKTMAQTDWMNWTRFFDLWEMPTNH